MADITLVTLGVVGPTGPGSVTAGSVITARGDLITGNATAAPARLAIGASGTYPRSNGTDLAYSAILAADLPTGIDAVKLGAGGLTNAELAFLATITSDVQAQINGKAATSHNHLVNTERGIYIDHEAVSLPDTDNTASTTVWANARDTTITLPTGTWKVHAIGGVSLKHSAAGAVTARVTVDGQDSTARTLSITSSTLYLPLMDDEVDSSVVGAFHVRVQFRSVDAGTTSAKNPWFFLVAERVS